MIHILRHDVALPGLLIVCRLFHGLAPVALRCRPYRGFLSFYR